jgi:hypothetical protein
MRPFFLFFCLFFFSFNTLLLLPLIQPRPHPPPAPHADPRTTTSTLANLNSALSLYHRLGPHRLRDVPTAAEVLSGRGERTLTLLLDIYRSTGGCSPRAWRWFWRVAAYKGGERFAGHACVDRQSSFFYIFILKSSCDDSIQKKIP